MELFRSRVAEESAKVAAAAMQLSALDDMAQQDEYVQSEGLKLSSKKKKECNSSASSMSGNSELPSIVEDLSGRFVNALSTAARKNSTTPPRHPYKDKVRGENQLDVQSKPLEKHIIKSAGGIKATSKTNNKPQLISSVAALYDQNTNEKSGALKQSTTTANDDRQPSVQHHKKSLHKTHFEKRGDISSASKTNDRSERHNTIPKSPKTDVLLVNDHAHVLHQLDYESDDSSGDDSDEHQSTTKPQNSDIEMGNLGLANQLEHEIEESIIRQSSLTGPTEIDNKQKDVNRFMTMTANLENERERLLQSYETESTPTDYHADTAKNTPSSVLWAQGTRSCAKGEEIVKKDLHEETNRALKAGLSWVQQVASPQLQALSKQIMTKVSPNDDMRQSSSEQYTRKGPMIGSRFSPAVREKSEEKIIVATSAAFLADDDMAELERIRLRNSTSKLQSFIQSLQKDKRLSFIVVTLIFALFAYFYSRHRSVDDVL